MKEIKLLVKNKKLGKYMVFTEGTYSIDENGHLDRNGATSVDKLTSDKLREAGKNSETPLLGNL
jgi:hypothetical protein